MTIKFSTTKKEGEAHGVKCLVYGLAGVGKTMLCATAPDPLIISNEAGLLSLRDKEIPVILVDTYDDLNESFQFVTESDDAKQFQTICLDSISEIAETILHHERSVASDPRQAYGELQLKTLYLCRKFRDLPGKHVYFSCKQERVKNDQSRLMNGPMLPGTKLPQDLPYLFDEVMALRAEESEDGVLSRTLQTQPTIDYIAKDRSGTLNIFEQPNLTAIFDKIMRRETNG